MSGPTLFSVTVMNGPVLDGSAAGHTPGEPMSAAPAVFEPPPATAAFVPAPRITAAFMPAPRMAAAPAPPAAGTLMPLPSLVPAPAPPAADGPGETLVLPAEGPAVGSMPLRLSVSSAQATHAITALQTQPTSSQCKDRERTGNLHRDLHE